VYGAQLKAIASQDDDRFEDITDQPDQKAITGPGEKAPQRRSQRLKEKDGR